MTDSDLVSQMQQPDFYPHAVSDKIELVQTHASLIFLTGKYAYKIKKNVNFGFLNYSTLAKRKHFIELELDLNSKIAPELYLEVLPISDRHHQLILNDSQQIVEYTLKMRQFPQEDLFSNLLERGLDSDRFVELGKIVAQFHQNAKTNDYISSFGTVAQIRTAFDENYQQSRKYIGVVQTREQYEATKAYTDTFLDARRRQALCLAPDGDLKDTPSNNVGSHRFFTQTELFQERIKRHKIKQCHGDLHLKNICLWRDRIQLFDRIEFNESFRFVDTMYDVAFTVMDLEAKGKPEFANAFLNSYLEHSGDWQGLLVLPLYLCRQAYVRAKVNSLMLDDPQVDDSDKQAAKKAASDYYRQAYEYTQDRSGSLILMSGLSGSGKSTVAKTIARNQGAIQIRSDAVRKHLAGIALDESGSDEIYTPDMTQKTYNRLLELGIMLAEQGYRIILDAKYDRIKLRQSVIARAKEYSLPLKIVYCTAPLAVLRDRLSDRQEDISDATADLLAQQQANTEPFTTEEQDYVTTVDTSKSNWQ